jgi:hypothetical protein
MSTSCSSAARRPALARALGLAHVAVAELDEPASGRRVHDDPHGFLAGRSSSRTSTRTRARSGSGVEGVTSRSSARGPGSASTTTAATWLAPQRRRRRPATQRSPTSPSRPGRASPSLHGADYRRPGLVPDGPRARRRRGRDRPAARARAARAPAATSSLSAAALARAAQYRGRDIFDGPTASATSTGRSTSCRPRSGEARTPLPAQRRERRRGLGLDRLSAFGVAITGRLLRFDGARAVFADDLGRGRRDADARLRKLLRRIDAHRARADRAKRDRRSRRPAAGPRTSRPAQLRRDRVGDRITAARTRGSRIPGVLGPRGRDRATARRDTIPASTRLGSRTSPGEARTSSAASVGTRRRLPTGSRAGACAAMPGRIISARADLSAQAA